MNDDHTKPGRRPRLAERPRGRLGGLVLLLAAHAAAAAPAATDADAVLLNPPPGDYVNLDTHRLYYHCEGRGKPTVVIDAGLGSSSLEWRAVQVELSAQTRVCSYDRAGYGWSDPGPSPRSTRQIAAELRLLLQRINERPPYVLVGHSFGGFTARYLASRYPDEVAAVVLVESSHPRQLLEFDTATSARHPLNPARFATDGSHGNAVAYAAGFLNSRRKAVFAQMDELNHFAQSAEEVTDAGTLGAIPLLVVARDLVGGEDREREREWRAMQGSLAALSVRGRLLVVPGAGHDMPLSHPSAVATAILDTLEELRAGF